MPAWPQDLASPITGATSPVAAAETVIATLAGVSTPDGSRRVELQGYTVFTTGTGTTGIQLRIRRTGLTGTIVGDSGQTSIIGAIGNSNVYSVQGVDTPGDLAAGVYVLTITAINATANGTSNSAQLVAQII